MNDTDTPAVPIWTLSTSQATTLPAVPETAGRHGGAGSSEDAQARLVERRRAHAGPVADRPGRHVLYAVVAGHGVVALDRAPLTPSSPGT